MLLLPGQRRHLLLKQLNLLLRGDWSGFFLAYLHIVRLTFALTNAIMPRLSENL